MVIKECAREVMASMITAGRLHTDPSRWDSWNRVTLVILLDSQSAIPGTLSEGETLLSLPSLLAARREEVLQPRISIRPPLIYMTQYVVISVIVMFFITCRVVMRHDNMPPKES
ncbi:hypothetical protein IG631_03982 [Alternaria alternata]|nr:hypothetical protein IG631_03982 [Alternaria alternata]